MKSKPTSMKLQPCYFGLRSPIWKQIKKQFCLWCLSSLAKKILTIKIWRVRPQIDAIRMMSPWVARKNLYSPPSKRIKQHGRQRSTNRTKHAETLQDEEGIRSGRSLRIFMRGTEMSYLSSSHLTDWAIKGDSRIQTKTVSCFVLNRESFCSVPSSMQKNFIESWT